MLFVSFSTALLFLVTLIWYFTASDDRTKRWVGLACSFFILINAVFSLFPPAEKIKLGLDLKGGTAFLLELQGEPSAGALDQAIGVIRKRIDKFGLSEPIIQPMGKRRISVQIPGLSESEKAAAKEQLSKVAKLEFRLVHPDTDKLLAAIQSGQEKIPLGYEILPFSQAESKEGKSESLILVRKREEMGGKYVRRAFRGFDEVGRPTVVIEFNEAGAKRFGEITSNNIGKRLAIVLDGEVKSAPVIQTAIFKNAVISGGNMTPKEAEDLASVLENPLETPVKILEERGVDPSLGKDSIISGINAALAAFASVVLFMVFYYRLAGIVAVVALLVNLLLLLGLLAQFHFTLTLPGIAGIILTIGMAVDANVLIYERIRDELEVGVNVKNAIFIGFNKAFSAIFDSNVSLIIPSIILMELGSGPLQGFAVTLVLGIVANLFAALVFSRNLFEWLLSWGMLRKLSMMKFLHKPNFDFIKWSWITVPAAAILLAVGIATFFLRSGELLGVDFSGGDSLTVAYKQAVPVAKVRQALEEEKIHPSLLQYSREGNQLVYQVRYGEGEKSVNVLKEKFPQAGFSLSRMDSVGPVVGDELKHRAGLALSLGLLAILIYVSLRYEWSFALAAALGQLHDVLLAIGIMALLGKEFDMYLIGAFLTILGYSINEKIVISDRIRETLKFKGANLSFKEIINEGINKTLARTIMTGGTVVLATISMLILGGFVISVFALAILIGVLAGMFSSHLITPALLYWFHGLAEKKRKKISIPTQAV
ncbi:protein translocase subunit SecDF [Candidatus Methylacidiphilum infernorum]|uniref:Multifunctional fusion protein n=1 Tax=Methylacidiphilum infernorum (isolate V4) TaxID=481448 RepID=B3DYE2_METI4|nr:protein translocase subunit SecDF [Candidatus Methylacidiphilum infernorum]ACD83990.1 Preprotein translocase subunit SecD [Methylacidiphilum infernorum V4]